APRPPRARVMRWSRRACATRGSSRAAPRRWSRSMRSRSRAPSCGARRRSFFGEQAEAGGQGVAEGDALLARLERDDLLDEDGGAIAAGQRLHVGRDLRAEDVVDVARAIAGLARELGD